MKRKRDIECTDEDFIELISWFYRRQLWTWLVKHFQLIREVGNEYKLHIRTVKDLLKAEDTYIYKTQGHNIIVCYKNTVFKSSTSNHNENKASSEVYSP